MLYDLARAHSRSPASRRRVENVGFVRLSVSTYSNIWKKKDRARVRAKEREGEREREKRHVNCRCLLKSKGKQIRMELSPRMPYNKYAILYRAAWLDANFLCTFLYTLYLLLFMFTRMIYIWDRDYSLDIYNALKKIKQILCGRSLTIYLSLDASLFLILFYLLVDIRLFN